MRGGRVASAMTCVRNVASGATICLTFACSWNAPPLEIVDGAERLSSCFQSCAAWLEGRRTHAFLGYFRAATPIKRMTIMKGKVKVAGLNNTHVTYFYYPADSTSLTRAGKDPCSPCPKCIILILLYL